MGLVNIFNDIEFKNDKNTTIIKWIVSIALFAIISAYAIGQIKSKFFRKIDDIEILTKQNKNSINKLRNNIKLDVKQIHKQNQTGRCISRIKTAGSLFCNIFCLKDGSRGT